MTIVVSPLWKKTGFRGSGEWIGEDEIPGGDVLEFAANWIAAAALGRLVLVRYPFTFGSLIFGRVGVLDPTNPHVGFGVDDEPNHDIRIIKRFEPLPRAGTDGPL